MRRVFACVSANRTRTLVDPAVINALVQLRVNVDDRTPDGFTPLAYAVYKGHIAAVKRL